MTPEFQYTFAFDVREAQDRDDLVVGPANAAAVAWVDRWPDWQPPGLVLIGPPAAGKSHLGAVWCRRSGAARHPAAGLNPALEAARGGARALLIEDVDDAADEDSLFRLVNAMIEARGHLLVTCQRPPAQLGLRVPDLLSRLRAMQSVFLGQPDDELLGRVIKKQFGDRGVRVDNEVILFLLRRMQRSFVAARRLVAELDAAALARRRKLTIPFVRAWFADAVNRHA